MTTARASVWLNRLKPRKAGVASAPMPRGAASPEKPSWWGAWRPGGAAPTYRAAPASPRSVTAARGRWGLSGLPAPVGSSVTSTGISATAQCPNPLPVGASGSKHVTAKLLVSPGKPAQDSCGEMSSPPAPKTPETCGSDIRCPSAMSVLVTVKDGTSGRNSKGNSGRLAAVMAAPYVKGQGHAASFTPEVAQQDNEQRHQGSPGRRWAPSGSGFRSIGQRMGVGHAPARGA